MWKWKNGEALYATYNGRRFALRMQKWPERKNHLVWLAHKPGTVGGKDYIWTEKPKEELQKFLKRTK